MNRCIRWLVVFGSTSWLMVGMSFAAIADQLWSGAGQIISGQGQGGAVKPLRLSVSDDRSQVTFQSGSPSRGKTIPLSGGAGQDGNLRYEFVWQGGQLQVTVQAEDQVILYELQPGG